MRYYGNSRLIIGIRVAVVKYKVFYVYVDPKILAVDDAIARGQLRWMRVFRGAGPMLKPSVAGKSGPNSCVCRW